MRRRIGPSGVAALAALLLPSPSSAQEATDLGQLAEFIRWGGVVGSIPVVIGALLLIGIIEKVGGKISARFANRRLTVQKLTTIIRFVIYLVMVAITIGLSVRLDPTALAVIGGSLAFAVGFALRDLVASFLAGITIIFDRPFQVGDRVTYGGEYGDIIKIGLRSVQMNTLDHNIITIPNNRIFTDVTASGNYGNLEMQVAMDFYVGLDQDVKLASEIIREACLTSPYVYLEEQIPVLAKQVILQDYVAFHLKVRPYVFDYKFEKPFETDVHFRVLETFRDRGISPPAVLHRSVPA